MKRRDLMSLFAGAAIACPLASRAEQPAMPAVGFLGAGSAIGWETAHLTAAFRQGLSETGYVEGRNVAIEYRWAEGHYERLPTMAAELVSRQVGVIAAMTFPAALAAKAATATIPIVFYSGSDPIEDGLVASLNKPGGNVTGVTVFHDELGAKRLELLSELLPKTAVIDFLLNPANPGAENSIRNAREAARERGYSFSVLHASTNNDIETTFANLAEQRVDALIVAPDPLFFSQRERIVTLAARHAVPAIYTSRAYTDAGGLISYGNSIPGGFYQAGLYTGRILDGAKPVDLPVVRATRFELVINLNTAKELGLTIPRSLLALADEVIE
jgi:putative ABC transport system substrate-binding protein